MELKQAWSYSALTSYETCPRRFQLTELRSKLWNLKRRLRCGVTKCTKRLKTLPMARNPCPKTCRSMEVRAKIQSYEGKRIVEERVALDSKLRPTTWMAKDVWVRGIIDIGVVGSERAYVLDWKTGKHRPDSDQLKLFAALTFALYPWIETVVTGFIWLKAGKFDKEVFTRAQLPEIWNDFSPRLERLAVSHDKDKWLPNPSGLCKNWCPVGMKLCEFCGK